MSNTTIPVIKFLFRDDFKVLNEALNIKPGYETEEFNSPNDLATFLSTTQASLVMTALRDKNDLIQVATFVKISKKIAKDTAFKIVVINFSGDRSFEKAIAKLGIQDIIEPAINTKALKFKLDFWMKSLNVQMRNSNAAQKDVKKIDGGKTNGNVQDKKLDPSLPVWKDALELEDDIWLIKSEADCKKILSKWLVRMVGPSPYVGQWNELKSGLWKFDVKESEREMYVPNNGAWYFAGEQKPDFIWKENIWMITGESFELFFKNEAQIHSRLKARDKVLSVCKNSIFAKTKEQIIIESFDKELVFKREAEKLDDLEGKNKTDQINNGHLQGKNKTAADRSGNLSGKTEGEAPITNGNLSGKTQGESPITNGNLEQKLDSTARENKFWNGKNKYEEPQAGGKDLGIKPDEQKGDGALGLDIKNQDHQKYYKNHNEAEEFGTANLTNKEKLQKEMSAKSEMDGHSSTDHIPKHYDNQGNDKNRSVANDNKGSKDLSGKSDTEKLKSHYGSKDGSSAGKETRDDDDYQGSGSTDRLASHYGKSKRDGIEGDPKERSEDSQRNSSAKDRPAREREEAEAKQRDAKGEVEGKRGSFGDELERQRQEKRAAKEREQQRMEEAEQKKRSNEIDKLERDQAGKPVAKKDRPSEKDDDQPEAMDPERGLRKDLIGKEQEKYKPEMKGGSNTDKLAAHYGGKIQGKKADSQNEEEGDDEIENEFFSKSRDKKGTEPAAKKQAQEQDANDSDDRVVPLAKVREEKSRLDQKALDEKGLAELTSDAKVVAVLRQKGKDIPCSVDDFFDETIIFSTTSKAVDKSTVTLDMNFKFLDKDTKLKIDGSVLSIEGDGEGNQFVTVEISKENASAFSSFMKLYSQRQENISEFLKRAKGL